MNSLGYASIWWTVDTLGWKGNPDDGSTLDADALPTLITELRARGYSFVTVAQFM